MNFKLITMDNFKQHLTEQKFLPNTIMADIGNVSRFLSWLKGQELTIPEVRYQDMLSYIQQEKQRNIQPATINLRLNSIRKYFEYLKKQGEIEKNPVKTLHIKGRVQQVVQNPLSKQELEQLYHEYSQLKKKAHRQEQVDMIHARNTVILGLLIWQGIHSGELQKMETGHINLDKGSVYIPSTTQSSSRQLSLSGKQMISLHQYLTVVRNYFKPKGDELVPGSVRNVINQLVAELQGLNPLVSNALHIRASVILNWLKVHPKREVQYMAGHKYISSTEKYAAQEIEDLQDALSKHHPFG